MRRLLKKTIKETKFEAFMQEREHNLIAIRGGENPPPDEEEEGILSLPPVNG